MQNCDQLVDPAIACPPRDAAMVLTAAPPIPESSGIWAEHFRRAYLQSLGHHRQFYDDFSEYGRSDGARCAFYFIPGINGTPGQIRFALPSLLQRFGREIYLRACYLPEFSSNRPVWEKYSGDNVLKKRAQVARDLEHMLAEFPHVYVVASSNGFYDLVAAWDRLPAGASRRLTLLWVACAPDQFETSPWVERFYRWTGFQHEGFPWAAVPNGNWLCWMNSESSTLLRWRRGRERRTFFKADIESRFRVAGICWAYVSPECFNHSLESVTQAHSRPLDVATFVLAGSRDGYWHGQPPGALQKTLDRYLVRKVIVIRPASHLWVVTPDHLDIFLAQVPDPPR
jgi:hypothetical protein